MVSPEIETLERFWASEMQALLYNSAKNSKEPQNLGENREPKKFLEKSLKKVAFGLAL